MERYRRKPRRDAVHREVWGVQDRIKRKGAHKGKAKKQGEKGGTPGDLRGVKIRDWNENAFARPNGLRGDAEIVISCRGPGPARKEKDVYQ